MKRMALALVMVLALAAPGWGAAQTCYVSPLGSNTSPYNTWATAATTPNAAISYLASQSPAGGHHTCYIAGGYSYNSYISLSGTNFIGIQIMGTAGVNTTAAPTSTAGYPVITFPASRNGLYLETNVTGVLAQYLTFNGANSPYDIIYMQGSGHTIDHVYCYNAGRSLILNDGGTDCTVRYCLLTGAGGDSGVYWDGSGTFYYNVLTNSVNKSCGATQAFDAYPRAGLTLNLYNNTIMGADYSGVTAEGAGTTNLVNNNINAGISANPGFAIARVSGTLNSVTNNLVGRWNNFNVTYGTINYPNGNHDIVTAAPGYVRHQRSGFIILRIDDSQSANYVLNTVAPVWKSLGVTGSYVLDTGAIPTYQSDINAIHANYSNAVKFGSHSYSHSMLTTTGNVFSISKAGATINIDRTANTITVNPGGTVTGFKSKTLNQIRTELTALGCTLGANNSGFGTGYSSPLGELMADSGGAQASPYTPQILIDLTCVSGFFKTEMADSKAAIEAAFGISCVSFATPTGATNTNVETAAKNAGYYDLASSASAADFSYQLSNIGMYRLAYLYANQLATGAGDATTKANTRKICEMAAQQGGVLVLIAHGQPGLPTGELTSNDWNVIISTIKNEYPEITLGSQDDFANWIRTNSAWSTADGGATYTRTWTDLGNYQLKPSSPSIDAGVYLGLTVDFLGNSIVGLPDIGAYEFQGTNTAPIVTITNPANGATFASGSTINFSGTAIDAQNGDLSSSLIWTSSIDGNLGTGSSFSRVLSTGTHTITAKATDLGGLTGTATITLTVNANTAPVVTITGPANGSTVPSGTAVVFMGTATDAESGNLTAGLTWTSSIDGPIGTGGSFSKILSSGTHTITASVTDPGGLTGKATISITVQPGNTAPVVTISSPANGATFASGTLINFSGTATDTESGNLTAGLTWTSSIDGPIGTGGSFSKTLSSGTHAITASVTDPGGLTGTKTISITVQQPNTAPVVTITSPANGATFASGALINFSGTATDTESGNLTASLTWTSSIDGPIGTGGSFSKTLSSGTHTITASATDPGGLTGRASISITVQNGAQTYYNIDYYPETNQESYATLYNGYATAVSQSFTGSGKPLNQAKFYIQKVGSPTGTINVDLYAHTGTFGTSSAPTGSSLANAQVDISTVGGSFALVTFTFNTPYTVAAGTHYCIGISYSGGNASNYLEVGADNNSPTHPGNMAVGSTPYSTWDLIFYCLTSTP